MMPIRRFLVLLLATTGCAGPALLLAHGGVVAEDDLCVINIGYLKAHFKIVTPQATGHREYCEDIPVAGESLFLMEYLHDGLDTAPVSFRIIRNTTGKGNFARLADVEALPDLDAVTVRYEPPSVTPGAYALLHEFALGGEYIGIVSAEAGRVHTAVFPFTVGSTGAGVWPWLLGLLILLQVPFWYRRRPAALARAATAAVAAAVVLVPLTAAADTAVSVTGRYAVDYRPALQPIEINRMHHWDLYVTDAEGRPVTGASIEVDGGMPAHDHGLPTAPRSSATDEPGRYRVDGLRFHMPGAWVIEIRIDDGVQRDRVRIALSL